LRHCAFVLLAPPLQFFFALASASQKLEAAAQEATVAMASAVQAPRNSPSRTGFRPSPLAAPSATNAYAPE
jgi:hypothetical protein